MEAAGGWSRWQAQRDVSFVSTLTIYDPFGAATSETIFLHKQPLHDGLKTRLESIGLRDELVFGFDGRDTWMFEDGTAVLDPARTAFTEFHGVSMAYWFGLPFTLAEIEAEVRYAGKQGDGGQVWERLRVDLPQQPHTPVDWMVLYIDMQSGLIDRVHCHVSAPFLRQSLWVGHWREYRDYHGLQRERRRSFLPADMDGHPVGGLAAEQIIEHVRFNNGFAEEMFERPLSAGGGSPAG